MRYALLGLALLGCSVASEGSDSTEANQEANNPKVTLRTPTLEDGSALPAKITQKTRVKFSVKATDDTKVARVELYDVRGLVAVDTAGTHTGAYDLLVDIGPSHTGIDNFYAVAVDTSGNQKVSASVALDIDMVGNTSDSLTTESASSAVLDGLLANALDGAPEVDLLGFAGRATSYIPPKLDASSTGRLRHSMPATLGKLGVAYTILDQKGGFDACERLAVLRVAAQHAERLYGVNEIQKGRVVGNVALRQAFALHAAGLLLTKEMPKAALCTSRVVAPCPTCAATGQKVLAAAKTAISQAFDPTVSSVFVNFRDDGHYAEGFSYSNFALEAIVSDAIVRARFEGTNILNTPTIEGQENLLPKFLSWFALGQRWDGTWAPVNDSSGVKSIEYIEPMLSMLAGTNASAYGNLHRAWCRSAEKEAFSNRLAHVLYGTRFENDACSPKPPGEALFPYGGQLHLRNEKIGLSTSAYNEAAWYKSSTREDWANLATATSEDSDRFIPLFFFDFAGRPAAPGAPIASNDFSWASKLLASSADKTGSKYWHFKEYNHRRFNDGHFEISAFGKNLLIGPGFSPYDPSLVIDEFRLPRAHNLLEVNGVFAKTDLATTVKAERLATSARRAGRLPLSHRSLRPLSDRRGRSIHDRLRSADARERDQPRRAVSRARRARDVDRPARRRGRVSQSDLVVRPDAPQRNGPSRQ